MSRQAAFVSLMNADRQRRLMTEGVGETSGETVGSPSAQGQPCRGTVRQKSKSAFRRCGDQSAISPDRLSGWNLGSDVFTDALVPFRASVSPEGSAVGFAAPRCSPDQMPAFLDQ